MRHSVVVGHVVPRPTGVRVHVGTPVPIGVITGAAVFVQAICLFSANDKKANDRLLVLEEALALNRGMFHESCRSSQLTTKK